MSSEDFTYMVHNAFIYKKRYDTFKVLFYPLLSFKLPFEMYYFFLKEER